LGFRTAKLNELLLRQQEEKEDVKKKCAMQQLVTSVNDMSM
jgi:hypothetical protein